jgi:hypothetical protein
MNEGREPLAPLLLNESIGLIMRAGTGQAWPNLGGASSVLLIFAALLFSSQLALAQFTQQGPKLVGSLPLSGTEQGSSVALSADGNTVIVGGPFDSNTGAAWVFTQSGTVWTQQGSKLVGSGAVGNAQQGRSVALSADGNTAIVGGPIDNSGVGAAWVFVQAPTVTAIAPTSGTTQARRFVHEAIADDIGVGGTSANHLAFIVLADEAGFQCRVQDKLLEFTTYLVA